MHNYYLVWLLMWAFFISLCPLVESGLYGEAEVFFFLPLSVFTLGLAVASLKPELLQTHEIAFVSAWHEEEVAQNTFRNFAKPPLEQRQS